MTIDWRARVRAEVDTIYGRSGRWVADQALERADEFRRLHPRAQVPPHERMDQRDAILITYADSILGEGEAPLATLRRWLDGPLADTVSAVHLLPFYPWSSDDGFAVQDYRSVEPSYGSWQDVHAVATGRRLMVDAVVNHASAQGEWFARFLRDEKPYRDWFRTEAHDTDLRSVVRPRTTPLLTPFDTTSGRRWVWTTFGPDQVDLDYRSPTLLLEIVDILLAYVDHGADIVRMDAVTYLWKEVGTSSVHHPLTHAVLRLLRAILEVAAPWVVLLTETNVPHAENVSYFGSGDDEAQMVYNFALPPLLLHTVASGDADALRAWARDLATPGPATWFLNFLASHDGIGVRPVESLLPTSAIEALVDRTVAHGGAVGKKRDADGGESAYELNVNYFDALVPPGAAEPTSRSVARFAAVHAVAMALPGVPAFYVHSLLGSRGDPALAAARGIPRAINRAKMSESPLHRELADRNGRRSRILRALSHLSRQRRAQAAFHPSAPSRVLDAPPGVFGVMRMADDHVVHAWHELGGCTTDVHVPVGGVDLVSGAVVAAGRVRLQPYQVLWVRSDGRNA